ncbi:hypothetical protein A3A64_03360 [Candidatus Gottesmanbacteria bacterium RIFCSPLOWO2_01_FULL_48_11]|uniref:BrnT family toxin n=2 Tax=Candidatus Gottesmaniibacteriota TaxID=1752720 RepID=A0A0G1WXY9_9BACT|nr:MAG: hypothetical protein UY27_C0025G0010 [Candidatus Gottesmanbacteria bacterium GW2011_GWA1_48_13]OGG27765.1 MAG: hypothetical protein A3A64_03360 [Candidatus Gottesmanbacteria bacterium RIFCSPLOWO2_01_FULL_48_11]
MTRIVVRKIVWDAFNAEHIKKHRVNQEEVAIVVGSPIYHNRAHSGRYLLVGRTAKRIIAVVIRREKTGVYYIVTARDADKKERRRVYEKEKSK